MIKEDNTATKIGCRKEITVKTYKRAKPGGINKTKTVQEHKKRQRIKPVSDKHAKDLREYLKISERLKELANHKSEFTEKQESYYDPLVTHHIGGRDGKNDLLNPFNMIITLHSEHNNSNEAIHKHNSFEKKEELRALVKPIRLSQGFHEEDYL